MVQPAYKNKKSNIGCEHSRALSSAFALKGGQDGALAYLKDNSVSVIVFMISGMKFEGTVISFDQYTICINDIKGRQQLIYKDKISTVALNARIQ